MTETSNSPPAEESKSNQLTAWDKFFVDTITPEVADLKAVGWSDSDARKELRRRHEGSWWEKSIDLALEMVTEEQVREARKETKEDAVRYVARMKADGLSDTGVQKMASVYDEPFAAFMKEALLTVTTTQIHDWRMRHPKPVRPISPALAKENELSEKLKKQPGYGTLTSEEKDLAKGILQWRWYGNGYMRIRFLCGDRSDPEHLSRFNKAWVVTNFVKAEMIQAGKTLPGLFERKIEGSKHEPEEDRRDVSPSRSPDQIKEDQLVERLKNDPRYGNLMPEEKRLAQRIVRERWRGNSYASIQHPVRHRYDSEYLKTFSRVWPLTDFVEAEMRLAGRKVPEHWRARRPRYFAEGEASPSPGRPEG